MTVIPPYLKKGDTIGLVAPAGFMDLDKMEACVNTLQDWGYSVRMGSTTHSLSANYFSGTDDERLNDLQEMLDDPTVNAVLCVRGGYGTSRIIDQLKWRKFKKSPKWIIGFSDVTVLHSHLITNLHTASLHAPMAAAFSEDPLSAPFLQSLKDALEGKQMSYAGKPSELSQHGTAEGILVGGNLSLLVHLIGTDSDIKTKNRILFLEDIGEYLYSLDRMFIQIKRSGKFDKLAGLVLGGFTGMKDTERPFGKSVEEILKEHVKDLSCPVCFDFPVSHERENFALKIGLPHKLEVKTEGVILEEVQ